MLETLLLSFFFFFFNDTATTEIYTLSLHDALPISCSPRSPHGSAAIRTRRTCSPAAWSSRRAFTARVTTTRSEEHTSELQSRLHLVCRLLLEKKKKIQKITLEMQSVPSRFPHR